jgi:hypothetical protein
VRTRAHRHTWVLRSYAPQATSLSLSHTHTHTHTRLSTERSTSCSSFSLTLTLTLCCSGIGAHRLSGWVGSRAHSASRSHSTCSRRRMGTGRGRSGGTGRPGARVRHTQSTSQRQSPWSRAVCSAAPCGPPHRTCSTQRLRAHPSPPPHRRLQDAQRQQQPRGTRPGGGQAAGSENTPAHPHPLRQS